MILEGISEKEYLRKVIVECECGHGVIEITQDIKWGDVYMSFKTEEFYNRQQPIWTAIKERVKFVWAALTGKSYQLFDLILKPEDVADLKSAVAKLDENLIVVTPEGRKHG